MPRRIDALARRVRHDPFFLASALADYARTEQLDEGGLASRLGCSLDDLGPLRLCRRPRSDPALFRQDVAAIAARFKVNGDVIAEAVRRADAIAAMQQTPAQGHGLLMAARDRHEAESAREEPEDEPS